MMTFSSSLQENSSASNAGDVQSASPSQIPESVPRYTSFDHITDPRIRRAKEYEQFLCFAQDKFPEMAARIQSEIEWAREQSKRDAPSDRDRVFCSIESEELCKSEIAEDLGMPESTVYKHLKNLVKLGLVTETRLPTRSDRGGNGMIVYGQFRSLPQVTA